MTIKQLIQRIFFLDPTFIINKSKDHHLSEEDMLPLAEIVDPKKYSRNLIKQLSLKTPRSFMWSLLKIDGKRLLWANGVYLTSTICNLLTPVFMNEFLKNLDHLSRVNIHMTILLGFFFVLMIFLYSFLIQHFYYLALINHQILINIVNERVFRQSLKLSLGNRAKYQLGDVVNYMSSDTEAVSDIGFIVSDTVMNTIITLGVLGLLIYYIGPVAFVALILMAFLFPLTKSIAKKFTFLEEELMHYRDKRVTLMGQILNSMRIVKFFSWEKSFIKEIEGIRAEEIVRRKKLAKAEVLSGMLYMSVSTIVLFVTLFIYVILGNTLNVSLILTVISLFVMLESPFGSLSSLLSRYINAQVAALRISNFLKTTPLFDYRHILPFTMNSNGEDINPSQKTHLKISNVFSKYDSANQLHVLKDINCEIFVGESVAVVGRTGAGKSSFLNLILGELFLTEGRVELFHDGELSSNKQMPRLILVPQEPYIQNSTLLENIQFGGGEIINPRDEFLLKILDFSELTADVNQFPAGLNTEIGEKGVNLSGGQKQRVQIARAMFHPSEIILMDDPFSALDKTTELKIASKLLFDFWKHKTRIVVTHRMEFLERFDRIIFFDQGKIIGCDTFKKLLEHNIAFKEFFFAAQNHNQNPDANHIIDSQNTADLKVSNDAVQKKKEYSSESNIKNDGSITVKEEKETGAVKKSIYIEYFRALGGQSSYRNLILSLLVILSLCVSVGPFIQKYWLTYFSKHQTMFGHTSMSKIWGILAYGAFGIFNVGLNVVNNYFWLSRGIKASKNLHNQMLNSVLSAPIRFFDSSPIGRIIQRFSRDIESIDVHLQWSFISVIHSSLQVIVALILILSLVPWLTILIIPILWIYYRVQENYRRPAREVKRFDSINRSPRYNHFKETLMGLPMIRSFQNENLFIEDFYKKLTHSHRMFYSHYMLNRWFSIRIPMVSCIVTLLTTLGIIYFVYEGKADTSLAGVVLIYSMSFGGYLNWGIRQFSDIESRMTSMERIMFYSQISPEEKSDHLNSHKLMDDQISIKRIFQSDLTFNNVFVRYAPHLPYILKGIHLKIRAGSRVGIMGRTGAGKSTLFQALFRFIEIEKGEILLGETNIATLPLVQLRKNLAMIPQEPVLFEGTIRSNLDRFDEFQDEDIYKVLKQTELYQKVSNLKGGLYHQVQEGGSNFSQGEKQLFCFARALLIKASIIVLDEATANVDGETDQKIQKVLRNELRGVTQLIIAHRLETILDCDHIVELSNGVIIKEINHPMTQN